MGLVQFVLLTPGYVCRWHRFNTFFREHLKISETKFNTETISKANLPYDILFFESDVIWSPRYFGGSFNRTFFGALPSMAKMKKVVYSASMSNAVLTAENLLELDDLLKYPDAISMRERFASDIIRAHTNKCVADVIDPVLLADPEDFDEITSPRLVKRKYVLMYYPIRYDDYAAECARRYAGARGLKLVEVSLYPHHKLICKTFVSAGIEDFMSLIRNAEAVFCNSFHGACLSILFHREFYAFERRGGGFKYKDLCIKFEIENRFVKINEFREDSRIDWARIDTIRQRLKQESLEWLDQAIRG